MAVLTIPTRFYPGQKLSVTTLDANFTAVKTLFNTTKLNEDNLRRMTGITNDKKVAPYNYHVIPFGIPQVRLTASQTKTFFVWGYPYYKQPLYTDLAGAIGPDNTVQGNYPIQIKNLQCCYHSSATALPAGDTIRLYVSACHKNFVDASSGPAYLSVVPTTNDNVIAESDVTGWDDVVYAVAFVEIIADATVATRIINNITGAICVKMAHVR